MAHEFDENDADDDGKTDPSEFSISIDDSVLSDALAAVEMRLNRRNQDDVGSLDLEALAAVESELAIEVEEESDDAIVQSQASVDARLRAMDILHRVRGRGVLHHRRTTETEDVDATACVRRLPSCHGGTHLLGSGAFWDRLFEGPGSS